MITDQNDCRTVERWKYLIDIASEMEKTCRKKIVRIKDNTSDEYYNTVAEESRLNNAPFVKRRQAHMNRARSSSNSGSSNSSRLPKEGSFARSKELASAREEYMQPGELREVLREVGTFFHHRWHPARQPGARPTLGSCWNRLSRNYSALPYRRAPEIHSCPETSAIVEQTSSQTSRIMIETTSTSHGKPVPAKRLERTLPHTW